MTVLSYRGESGRAAWRALWDDLGTGRLRRTEASGMLSTLAPSPSTALGLVLSLDERREPWTVRIPGAVNIVGTGGGPRTFNISTAAAFVAAAAGTPVLKTGARTATSAYGSFELLDRIGVGRTTSPADTAETLERFGIAFAGDFVYPRELTLLAGAGGVTEQRAVRGLLNLLGPFLAAVPLDAQVTGVALHGTLPALRAVARSRPNRVWLCTNDLGADELLGGAGDRIDRCDGTPPLRPPGPDLATGEIHLDDLRPVTNDADLAGHFRRVLADRGGPAASRAVRLNAAALLAVHDPAVPWADAVDRAARVMWSGAAADLADRVCDAGRVGVSRG